MGAQKRNSRVSISMRGPVTIHQSIPSQRIGKQYCYVSHEDTSHKRSIFGCFNIKLDKSNLPKISFTRVNNQIMLKIDGVFPIIGKIESMEVNDDSSESMVTRNNGKKGYRSMEKHRDYEFTIHESEAGNEKRKNQKRYRFVFSEDKDEIKVEIFDEN